MTMDTLPEEWKPMIKAAAKAHYGKDWLKLHPNVHAIYCKEMSTALLAFFREAQAQGMMREAVGIVEPRSPKEWTCSTDFDAGKDMFTVIILKTGEPT